MATGEHWLRSACPIMLQFLSHCLNPSGDVPYSTVEYIDDFMFEYPIFLWVLVSMTWLSAANDASQYLGMSSPASLVISYALAFSAVLYKICSTQAFNPELVNFMPVWLESVMLDLDRNYCLRVFWTGLIACIVYLLFQSLCLHGVSRKSKSSRLSFLQPIWKRLTNTRSTHGRNRRTRQLLHQIAGEA